MSACISSHGEYSSHTPSDEPFVCSRCAVFDEDAAMKEITALRESLDLWGKLYREAVGVPAPEHQKRRMDQVAEQWEQAVAEASRLRAEIEAADGQRRATEARFLRLRDRWRECRDLADRRLAQVEAAETERDEIRQAVALLTDEIRTAPAETWGVDLRVPDNAEAAYIAGADAAVRFATGRLRAALAIAPAVTTREAKS